MSSSPVGPSSQWRTGANDRMSTVDARERASVHDELTPPASALGRPRSCAVPGRPLGDRDRGLATRRGRVGLHATWPVRMWPDDAALGTRPDVPGPGPHLDDGGPAATSGELRGRGPSTCCCSVRSSSGEDGDHGDQDGTAGQRRWRRIRATQRGVGAAGVHRPAGCALGPRWSHGVATPPGRHVDPRRRPQGVVTQTASSARLGDSH